MEFDKSKLEKWISEIPECGDFLNNFFISCREDMATALTNYKRDIEIYGLNHERIRRNSKRLMNAFEEITGMKIYYG